MAERMSVSFDKAKNTKEILERVSAKTGISKSALIIRALNVFFRLHEKALHEGKYEKFLSDFMEEKDY